MNKEIRIKRNELKADSIKLRNLSNSFEGVRSFDLNQKIRKEQDERFKKYKFYDNLIKASDKVKSDKE